jgi:hemoglobin
VDQGLIHRHYHPWRAAENVIPMSGERMPVASVYEAAGGEATFRTLVRTFYAGVATDPVLRPIYPEQDLSDATERLTLFLIQYWGGPNTYSEVRGHPRLRMRHHPFVIRQRERDAWLGHMTSAVDSLGLRPNVRKALLDYFETASTAMINQGGSDAG